MAGESTLFQEQWDSRVIHVYQQKGYLTRGMSMGPSKIIGQKMHFPIMGKGVAQDYTVRDTVKKMNVMKGEVTLDAAEWDAADDIFDYEMDRMAANIKDALVDTAGMALGRHRPQPGIDHQHHETLPRAEPRDGRRGDRPPRTMDAAQRHRYVRPPAHISPKQLSRETAKPLNNWALY